MKHQKSQRRSRSLFVRRKQASSVPPIDNPRWPVISRTSTKEVVSSTTQANDAYKRVTSDQSRDRQHTGPSSHWLRPWGYAAGPPGFPTPYGTRSTNLVYPTPPTVAASSAPHYSRTFLLKQQAERDKDSLRRQQRLEVSQIYTVLQHTTDSDTNLKNIVVTVA